MARGYGHYLAKCCGLASDGGITALLIDLHRPRRIVVLPDPYCIARLSAAWHLTRFAEFIRDFCHGHFATVNPEPRFIADVTDGGFRRQ
ncbi:MAG TPA: hypothetical protein DD416_01880 [Rhodobacteraceae bacterium]|nr:hypothetical protein [Paracoccaceae bacterium]